MRRTALVALGHTGTGPPELIVLGDLFELALSSTEEAAATFAHLVVALAPGTADAAIAPGIRFVPGNHDHHLWSRARGACYLEHISGLPRSQALPVEAHATRLLPDNDPYPVHDTLIELLAARADTRAVITVGQSYPNFGIADSAGRKAVVFSHGHFIEPLYRAMSALQDLRQGGDLVQPSADEVEAENGAWIDFFWSSMGDSGDVGRWARQLYESLQSDEAIEEEIDAMRRTVSNRPASRVKSHLEGLLLDGGLTAAVKRSLRRERHEPVLLSDTGRKGLTSYLSGPVARQVDDEIGSATEVAFVFGHTHKPFTDLDHPAVLPGPGTVINTGGWVVDTTEAEPNKGAAVIIIDEDLNIAALRCFGQGAGVGHAVVIDGPPGEAANPLVSELREHDRPGPGSLEGLGRGAHHRRGGATTPAAGPPRRPGDGQRHPRRTSPMAPRSLRGHPAGAGAGRPMMDRLSRPVADLKAHYDVVVVGSGYGGSIAACRLARAGRKVAVLERGRELHPGEYPASLEAASRHVQTASPLGHTGDPRSLYWVHVGSEMSVFSGCGLGGTSLVNANVALRPDPRIFEDSRWPRALARGRGRARTPGTSGRRRCSRPAPTPNPSRRSPRWRRCAWPPTGRRSCRPQSTSRSTLGRTPPASTRTRATDVATASQAATPGPRTRCS